MNHRAWFGSALRLLGTSCVGCGARMGLLFGRTPYGTWTSNRTRQPGGASAPGEPRDRHAGRSGIARSAPDRYRTGLPATVASIQTRRWSELGNGKSPTRRNSGSSAVGQKTPASTMRNGRDGST
jgi:hypothetical protein